MTCDNICEKYKANDKNEFGSRYALGQKRCSNCSIFIYFDGIKCPCCNTTLKTSPTCKNKIEFHRY